MNSNTLQNNLSYYTTYILRIHFQNNVITFKLWKDNRYKMTVVI